MDPQAASLLAQKVTRELYRIAQAYGKTPPFRFEDLAHDFAVMLEHNCLHSISLKFHLPDARREVLVEYSYELHAGRPHFYLDDAQGLGVVPLPPPFEMGLAVNRDSQDGAYRHRLRLNWGDAPHYTRGAGFAHQDGNTTKRTGGRASKQIFMSDGLRCSGKIKFFLPDKQYGFITGHDGVDIFFHANNVAGFHPAKGQRVSYLPLATPRGIQAKDVQRA